MVMVMVEIGITYSYSRMVLYNAYKRKINLYNLIINVITIEKERKR